MREPGMDLNGAWKFEDSAKLADAAFVLRQEGARISGAAYYDSGAALVEGRADAAGAGLFITYDAPWVLTKWLPERHAAALRGLRSRMCVKWGTGATPFVCTYQGFFVRFSPRGGIAQIFDADTPGVEDVHPPRLGLLHRIREKSVLLLKRAKLK